jgi:zinc protease
MTVPGQTVDRHRPPAAGAPRPFAFPPFDRRRLDSGLEVFLCRLPRVPMVCLDFYAPGGAHHDPAAKAGLARLTALLLDEGTRHRDANQIATIVEQLGGRLQTGAGWNSAHVSTTVLAQDLEVGLELLAEVVREPTFPRREVERLKGERLAELIQTRTEPSVLAARSLDRALYGEAAYGQPIAGDEATVTGLAREDIDAFYRAHYRASGSALVAVGDFDEDALLRSLEQRFSSFKDGALPPLPAIETAPLDGLRVFVVDRPEAAQTELRLGQVGISRRHPDFPDLVLLNAILGGKFTSRINLNLRERHGYTYGAHSQLTPRLGPGPFVISTAVSTEVAGAAVGEVLAETRRIRQEAVTATELADAKSYLQGTFLMQLETLDDIGQRLGTLAVFNLPSDYWEHYLVQAMATDEARLLHLAGTFLQPERMAIVAVGPAQALVPQLAPLGPVTVWDPMQDQPASSP